LRRPLRKPPLARGGTLCAWFARMDSVLARWSCFAGMVVLLVGASGCAADTSDGEDDADDGVAETSEAITTFSTFQRRNLAVVNAYRARKGLVPLKLSASLSTFAQAGSVELSHDHKPHAHFIAAGAAIFKKGFKLSAGENQGDPHGWPVLVQNDPAKNRNAQIDDIQKVMFAEGPGAGEVHGHYMNIMNPKFRRIGVGLVDVGGKLYLTNDFSE
jgi:hypothetical protein